MNCAYLGCAELRQCQGLLQSLGCCCVLLQGLQGNGLPVQALGPARIDLQACSGQRVGLRNNCREWSWRPVDTCVDALAYCRDSAGLSSFISTAAMLLLRMAASFASVASCRAWLYSSSASAGQVVRVRTPQKPWNEAHGLALLAWILSLAERLAAQVPQRACAERRIHVETIFE